MCGWGEPTPCVEVIARDGRGPARGRRQARRGLSCLATTSATRAPELGQNALWSPPSSCQTYEAYPTTDGPGSQALEGLLTGVCRYLLIGADPARSARTRWRRSLAPLVPVRAAGEASQSLATPGATGRQQRRRRSSQERVGIVRRNVVQWLVRDSAAPSESAEHPDELVPNLAR
jgi:hypothetical protein